MMNSSLIRHSTARLGAGSSLLALVFLLSCSGSDDASGSDTQQQSGTTDAGAGADGSSADASVTDPGGSGTGDSLEPGGEEPDDQEPGQNPSDEPLLGVGGSGEPGDMMSIDASIVDETTDPTLPGGGFVAIEEGDAGQIEILCGTEVCACADGLDNDGDGVTDGLDSECTGPFDNDEDTFATGIPGDNRDPKWQDCFFDGNSGAGDDGCRYHTDCLTGETSLDAAVCMATDECRDYCEPLTPPGCDCFGCCEIDNDGESVNILVSDTCSLEVIDDEDACPRCIPTELCSNECGECEICLGQTLEDLPESCFDDPPDEGTGGNGSGGNPGGGGSPGSGGDDPGGGGMSSGGSPNGEAGSGSNDPPDDPPNECDNGATPCFETADCNSGSFCSLGCCIALPAR